MRSCPGIDTGWSPLLLRPRQVGTAGFEPATPATPLQCATGLRYVPELLRRRNCSHRADAAPPPLLPDRGWWLPSIANETPRLPRPHSPERRCVRDPSPARRLPALRRC